jgi:hypothetical protein
VRRWVEANISTLEREEAWNEAALHWLSLLQSDLGGGYQILQTIQSTLLTDLPSSSAGWLLDDLSRATTTIQGYLKKLVCAGWCRKNVVLVFGD